VTRGSATGVLITGIAGQDGSYLAELLCAEGAQVHGALRRAASREAENLAAVADQIVLHELDVEVPGALAALLAELTPSEIYHLASPTFVPDSWERPAQTISAITGVVAELLDAVRAHAPTAHLVLASSREIFGAGAPSPQDEQTPGAPSNPYGVAKLAAYQLAMLAREHWGLRVSSAILFNHESPRRPATFISRKVTRGAAAISLGLADELVLGDLDAVRDWSSARDIVRGMRLMAGASEPSDYVLASGVGHTVRELVDVAFALVGVDPDRHLRVDQSLVRPPESSAPVGNPARARAELGWSARVSFEELIEEMVRADLRELSVSPRVGRTGATRP
jgi:GDPmannose 4,6-dehydratase